MFRSHACAACGLRFPAPERLELDACPACRAALATSAPWGVERAEPPAPPLPLRLLADSLRSLYNVGALFRAADAFGVEHLYLCGTSGTPPREKIAKVALGAEAAVPWSRHPDVLAPLAALRAEGWPLVALEVRPDSVPIGALPPISRAALVVGNEVCGLAPEVLAAADHVVHLPHRGVKTSLNVTVATGVALYALGGLISRG